MLERRGKSSIGISLSNQQINLIFRFNKPVKDFDAVPIQSIVDWESALLGIDAYFQPLKRKPIKFKTE